MIKKGILILISLYLMLLLGFYGHERYHALHPFLSTAPRVYLPLRRGAFMAYHFKPDGAPKAVIIFGSGDGGWWIWEERVCYGLRAAGYDVLGVDSASYAKTDYDLATLQADYGTMARKVLSQYGTHPPPLIIGGFSMGAAQAIAVVGGPHPPAGVVGLLIASPLSRGRYGLRVADQLNILPSGPGTFAVEDFANGMDRVRVVQWHAQYDPFDSRAWLKDLKAEHREFDEPGVGHDYNQAPPDFVRHFAASVDWILHPDQTGAVLGQK